jgi:Ca-activated chloride channel family protein
VRPDEDIEAHVSRLYTKIGSPAMTKVEVKLEMDAKSEEGEIFNRRYPKKVNDLFEGEQLVIVGRYKKAGDARVTVTGKIGGEEKKFDFPAKFNEQSGDESYAFVEKLWAMRRIGEIIDELDLKGKNDELVTELVTLSTKHGILTPYTAFLADETSKPAELANLRGNVDRARTYSLQLGEAEGVSGVAQRFEKKQFREADQAAAPAADLAAGGARKDAYEQAAKTAAANGRGGFGGAGLNSYRDIKTDKEVVTDAVLQVGNEALYRRGKQLIAENAKDVDVEKDKSKVKTIERFSDEYFKLVDANTATENSLLARQQPGEELLIKLRGQAYLIK